MLVPEVIEILGGVVDELEAARVRLVSEVNKPPRGKRYVLSLSISEHIRSTQMPFHCEVYCFTLYFKQELDSYLWKCPVN